MGTGRFGEYSGAVRTGRSIVYVLRRERQIEKIPLCASCGVHCTVCATGGQFSKCCLASVINTKPQSEVLREKPQ